MIISKFQVTGELLSQVKLPLLLLPFLLWQAHLSQGH